MGPPPGSCGPYVAEILRLFVIADIFSVPSSKSDFEQLAKSGLTAQAA